jgi:hypothetical protein
MCDTRPPGDLQQRSVSAPCAPTSPRGVGASGRPGLALVVLSMVEQRLDAVRAVLAGADVTEVAAGIGVHRSTVHRWVGRYLAEQLAGLVDRSHRPHSSPARVPDGSRSRWRRCGGNIPLGGVHGGSVWKCCEAGGLVQRNSGGALGTHHRPDPTTAGVAAVSAAETVERLVCAVGTPGADAVVTARHRRRRPAGRGAGCCGRRNWSPRSTTIPGSA